MSDNVIEIDFLPKFEKAAYDRVQEVFQGGLDKAFTKSEKGLIKEAFSKGLTAAFSDPAAQNRLHAAFRKVTRRMGSSAGAGSIDALVNTGGRVASRIGSGAQNAGLGVAGALAGGKGPYVEGFLSIVSSLTKFVEAANPAMIEMLSMAFKDVMAVVGHALMPLFESFIDIIRTYGDYVASILPDQSVLNGLLEATKPILDEMVKVMQLIAPILRELYTMLAKGLTWAIKQAAEAIVWMIRMTAKVLYETLNAMDYAVGVISNEWLKKLKAVSEGKDIGFVRTARGAAAGTADTSSIADLGKSLQLGALSLGATDPQVRMQMDIEDIRKWLVNEVGPGLQAWWTRFNGGLPGA